MPVISFSSVCHCSVSSVSSDTEVRRYVGRLLIAIVMALVVPACEKPPLTPSGVVGVVGQTGLGPGDFAYPRAIAAAPDGRLFVVDKSGRCQRFDAEGTFEKLWTMPEYAAGKPVGLTVHPDGRVFVADTHYHRVCIFDRDGTLLTAFGSEGTGDGQFVLPTDIAFDDLGCVYVGEYGGNDRISKFSADLEYVTSFGRDLPDGSSLNRPAGLAWDAEGTLWVADACNHRLCRFSKDGQLLTAFGSMGREPGQMRYPYDITVTPGGLLLVCEYGNCRLQWFTPDGKSVQTWGEPGRGLGQLWSPWGAAVGKDGLVYVVDSRNDRVQIVKP